ncbi:hypothetical protein LCGC14_1433660 [marine sediment metagenome]|uniref:Uncharacterized protein n=1 Tax=marine sediment metagenome TaxID=412755 RepID=A0A0F9MPP9_9ZZZZ
MSKGRASYWALRFPSKRKASQHAATGVGAGFSPEPVRIGA